MQIPKRDYGKSNLDVVHGVWRHAMTTISVLMTLCVENPPVTDGFPHEGLSMRALMFSFILA